jgi:hypothetical protein
MMKSIGHKKGRNEPAGARRAPKRPARTPVEGFQGAGRWNHIGRLPRHLLVALVDSVAPDVQDFQDMEANEQALDVMGLFLTYRFNSGAESPGDCDLAAWLPTETVAKLRNVKETDANVVSSLQVRGQRCGSACAGTHPPGKGVQLMEACVSIHCRTVECLRGRSWWACRCKWRSTTWSWLWSSSLLGTGQWSGWPIASP